MLRRFGKPVFFPSNLLFIRFHTRPIFFASSLFFAHVICFAQPNKAAISHMALSLAKLTLQSTRLYYVTYRACLAVLLLMNLQAYSCRRAARTVYQVAVAWSQRERVVIPLSPELSALIPLRHPHAYNTCPQIQRHMRWCYIYAVRGSSLIKLQLKTLTLLAQWCSPPLSSTILKAPQFESR